jgi:hypothetical protein
MFSLLFLNILRWKVFLWKHYATRSGNQTKHHIETHSSLREVKLRIQIIIIPTQLYRKEGVSHRFLNYFYASLKKIAVRKQEVDGRRGADNVVHFPQISWQKPLRCWYSLTWSARSINSSHDGKKNPSWRPFYHGICTLRTAWFFNPGWSVGTKCWSEIHEDNHFVSVHSFRLVLGVM